MNISMWKCKFETRNKPKDTKRKFENVQKKPYALEQK